MKNNKTIWGLFALVLMVIVSCEKTEDKITSDAVELPPMETIALNMDNFMSDPTESGKTNSTSKTGNNWVYPRVVVGF